MKRKIKEQLRILAKHFNLKIKFVHFLGDDIHGKLLPKEKRILVNARKPWNEHIYTILHEIGHYVLHFKMPKRKYHPRCFDIQWKIGWLAKLFSKVRRYLRFIFNKDSGKEWEANLWAMCVFIFLARIVGCHGELRQFLDRHPERQNDFRLVKAGMIYTDVKTRFTRAYQAAKTEYKRSS